jgi:hypothetical protein
MQSRAPAGYSGTSLAAKLGFKEASRVALIDAPEGYIDLLEPIPRDVVFQTRPSIATDIAQIFVTHREDLAKHLSSLRKRLKPEAAVWVSWPKKSSKVPTTVTEDTVREFALPLGFVDVKVCAVNEVWSGLKLVVRKELR